MITLLSLAATTAVVFGADPELDVSTVLAKVRAAMGYQRIVESSHGFVTEGTTSFLGKEVPYRFWFDGAGRFHETMGGALPRSFGYDGTNAFEIDFSGMPNKLALGDCERRSFPAWMLSGYWLHPEGPFTITLDPERTTADVVALKLRLKKGLLTAQMAIDRATWLPRSSGRDMTRRSSQLEFADYRDVSGIHWPHRITTVGEGGEAAAATISRMDEGTSEDRERCRWPVEPEDTDFAADVETVLDVKRVASGHLLVSAQVDGRDVGSFIFDSGAGMTCLANSLVSELGLERLADVQAMGAGGSQQGGFYRGRTFRLGRMTIENPLFVGIDLDSVGKMMGVKLAGVCGYDVFRRATVLVDMAAPRVEIIPPGDFELERTEWQELVLYGNHPCVTCSFDAGQPEAKRGIFKLDTGAGLDTVTFHAPAVKKLELLEGRTTTPVQLGGVGGMSPAQSGTIAFFELATHRFQRPRVQFSTAADGAFSDEYTIGNIGGRFMEPFQVVFDYAKNRIAFVPKASDR